MKIIILALFLAGNASAQTSIVTDFGITKAVGNANYVLRDPLYDGTQSLTASSLTVTGATAIGTNLGVATPISAANNIAVLSNILVTNSQMKIGDNGVIDGGAADANSRIEYFPSKYLTIKEGATERMNISATGVTIPGSSFSVGTSTFACAAGKCGVGMTPNASHTLSAKAFSATDSALGIFHNSGNLAAEFYSINNSGLIFDLRDTAGAVKLQFDTRANQPNYFNNGGNVGIGTTSPASKLDISSGTITLAGTGAPSAGYALCLTATKQIGRCSNTPAADGACTCAVN